nr:Chain E, VAL-GLY-ILE-THR-ASN-VAL-ASP-LEU [Mus musculus]5J6G_F Chain F, VAL-GLY-ILE-THR-ASN-VAL-ASP-LEU [Mus musculus]5J6H_F Chain F, VAL-GLY-ILE-THR-ASN-VAL-ASP-LEU [Mus musculus]
VGITNVDL